MSLIILFILILTHSLSFSFILMFLLIPSRYLLLTHSPSPSAAMELRPLNISHVRGSGIGALFSHRILWGRVSCANNSIKKYFVKRNTPLTDFSWTPPSQNGLGQTTISRTKRGHTKILLAARGAGGPFVTHVVRGRKRCRTYK